MYANILKNRTLIFEGKPTKLQIGDFAKINIETNTIAFLRKCTPIYVDGGTGPDSKIYIGPTNGEDPSVIVLKITRFKIFEADYSDDYVLFELLSKCDE